MNLWLGLLMVLVSTATAVAAMLAVRRIAPPSGFHADVSPSASVFGVLGTAFAVILAFVILLALQSYHNARQMAAQEAVAVTQLYRTSALLPAPAASVLLGELRCYGRAVAEDEWSIMEDGRESALVQRSLDEMGLAIASVTPSDTREGTAYGQWFERDTDRREGRRGRLIEAQPLVPAFLWIVLALSAVLVVGYALLFADPRESRVLQAIMTGSLTAVIALGLLVVSHLDRPYNTIGPSEMRRTLALMETTRLPVPTPAVLPCDERGAPLPRA